jgi:ABC-type branched-subunit amino acid transport system ATPase component
MSASLLSVQQLSKRFGGLTALSKLDMEVERGQITGLIGPNGAGKTTAFNLISGALKPSGGRIMLDGKDITGLSPHRVVGLGLARTFPGRDYLPALIGAGECRARRVCAPSAELLAGTALHQGGARSHQSRARRRRPHHRRNGDLASARR